MALAQPSLPANGVRSLRSGLTGPLSVLAAAGMMLAGMFLPVLQNSDATTTGYAIQREQQQLADLNAKTYALQAQIAALGSAGRIRMEAGRLGMVPAGRQSASVSVSVPAPVDLALPRSYLSEAATHAAAATATPAPR